MILQGSQRSGGAQLAGHLLNDRDNDHVTVHDVRGFVSEELREAFAEAQAISKGTKCKQYLFSLSLNPPKNARVSEDDFERAADKAERVLGLTGQPRALIFHEKEGRRHAHVVWSRIDAAGMKAVNMAHFKRKLTALSKDLFLEHGWELPQGLRRFDGKSPLNYSLAEYQQAKRIGLDPLEIKDAFRFAWTHSDTLAGFAYALEERGYFLAKGDSRALVAVDVYGEVYSVARFAGVKVKDLRERFGGGDKTDSYADHLPGVETCRADLAERVTGQLRGFLDEAKDAQAAELRPMRRRSDELRDEHRAERERLNQKQAERRDRENDLRMTRLRVGMLGLWDRITGKAALIKQQNAAEAYEAARRDRKQRDDLVFDQKAERSAVQERLDKASLRHVRERKDLHRDLMAHMRRQDRGEPDSPPLTGRYGGFTLDR